MEPRKALTLLLTTTLASRWRDRYVGFVASKKNQGKFLAALPHELLERFDRRAIVRELQSVAWDLPAYSFSYDGFGTAPDSLRGAHAELGRSAARPGR